MKNKKHVIIGIIIIVLIIIIGLIFLKRNKASQEDNAIKPDVVIKSTKNNEIKLEDFEAKKIDIYKTSDTSLNVKATLVNQSNKVVKGFFIQIGLFDKEGKRVTIISENHEEEIQPKETYILESGVSGNKRVSEITNAKIISIEKNIKADVDESYDEIN